VGLKCAPESRAILKSSFESPYRAASDARRVARPRDAISCAVGTVTPTAPSTRPHSTASASTPVSPSGHDSLTNCQLRAHAPNEASAIKKRSETTCLKLCRRTILLRPVNPVLRVHTDRQRAVATLRLWRAPDHSKQRTPNAADGVVHGKG